MENNEKNPLLTLTNLQDLEEIIIYPEKFNLFMCINGKPLSCTLDHIMRKNLFLIRSHINMGQIQYQQI